MATQSGKVTKVQHTDKGKLKAAIKADHTSTNTGKKQTTAEEASLLVGGPRVKFKTHWNGTIEDFFKPKPEAKELFLSIVEDMSNAMWATEAAGAAPVLPDGKVGGNAAAILKIGNENYIILSKSGKLAGHRADANTDFCIMESFDTKSWSANYFAASETVLPTSDAPLHYFALTAHVKYKWPEMPMASIHGHALETQEKAMELGVPISNEETLFSTPEDSAALMSLMAQHGYPKHKIFIRKGHGFILLGTDMKDAIKTFDKHIKLYI